MTVWNFSRCKVLMTTWTLYNKSFILHVYFNGASTSPFAACSVNNKECQEGAIISKINSQKFPKCLFSSDVFIAVAVVAA